MECQRHLFHSLVEHGQDLIDGQCQLGRQVVHTLVLQSHSAQQRRLDTGQSEVGTHAAREIQRCQRRDKVANEVMIAEVATVEFEPLKIVWRQVVVQLRTREFGRLRAGSFLHFLDSILVHRLFLSAFFFHPRMKSTSARHIPQQVNCQLHLHPTERPTEQPADSAPGIHPKCGEPSIVPPATSRQCSDHDGGVLSRQFIGRLTQIQQCHPCLALPKVVKRRC
mmetsp:Transcript_41878/g.87920  ORF Transcript_41878/g.87920 Transcript_41878/m.87920 type:complete len:223 (-) Transcript_41878:755-1423(-)